jgi:hypothetical protein
MALYGAVICKMLKVKKKKMQLCHFTVADQFVLVLQGNLPILRDVPDKTLLLFLRYCCGASGTCGRCAKK